MKIALLSMPWQDPYVPSIQLGALQSYVEAERPQVTVETQHLFLEIAGDLGLELAKDISASHGWVGEALFAYLLFPSQRAAISDYLDREWQTYPALGPMRPLELVERLRQSVLEKVERTDWSQYALVGLSVVFMQTLSSLLVAREIKQRAPHVPIVLGGPGCTNAVGKSLLESFDFIDYIVNGEGERPLCRLLDALATGDVEAPLAVRGVMGRDSDPEAAGLVDQLRSLDGLPPPRFDSYFDALCRMGADDAVHGRVQLPLESSRGCWWDRSEVDALQSCTFCNLNLQWRGYREKPVDRFLSEIETLAKRHEVLDILVVDNILRYKNVDALLDGLEDMDLELRLMIEARASVRPAHLERLAANGARHIQLGIEALSTGILGVINKGTTAIQNLQAMKLCEMYGIYNAANIIVDYPGVQPVDIEDELTNIELARAYGPLNPADFWLVYQAPAFKRPELFDIHNVRNYHMYRMLFPPGLQAGLFMTEKEFDSEARDANRALWARVRTALNAWAAHYHRQKQDIEKRLLLGYQDGGRWLRISDHRFDTSTYHVIREPLRALYLDCAYATSLKTLAAAHPELDVERAVGQLRRDKLVFVEGQKVLALAMPERPDRSERMARDVGRVRLRRVE